MSSLLWFGARVSFPRGLVVMPNATLTIIAGLVVAAIATLIVWRGTRKNDAMGYLKGVAVSRQWLMQHQGEDRS